MTILPFTKYFTMKKIILTVIISPLFLSFAFATTTTITKSENWHSYKVMKVVFDGNSKIVVSAVESWQPAQSLQTLMYNVWWTHAINGWFFCPNESAYSRCVGNTTDLVRKQNGVLYSKRSTDIGSNKSVFGFDENSFPLFVSDNGWYALDTGVDKIFNGIWMPTFVKDWVNVAVLNDAMNNDPKQSSIWNKWFICSTKDKSTVYMWYVDGVTFSTVADYLIQTFACDNAIQLDNGWSKAMIFDGAYSVWPGRDIMDAFVIIDGNNIGPVIMTWSQPYTSEQLQDAIDRMYKQWLTKYDTIDGYMPEKNMTREEAAKFFGVFAVEQFSKTEYSTNECDFYDINKADRSLIDNITQACRLWIFKWSRWNYMPKANLTNAEAITVLIRIMVWMQDESTQPWYTNYMTMALERELIGNINPMRYITRWEAAVLLYKGYLYGNK